MKAVKFIKMVASGNDFVVIEDHPQLKTVNRARLAKEACDRKFGIGADGLLLLEKSKAADIRMRIFNADGSEAQMCGNGARCTALFLNKPKAVLETKAGLIRALVKSGNVKIRLTDPKDLEMDMPLEINGRKITVNFINTGVPHAVIFSAQLSAFDIVPLAKLIRYHDKFSPSGTNVDFIEILKPDAFSIRTYERGVEDETLACGTGSVASAIIFALKTGATGKIKVHTKSKEILQVYFEKIGSRITNVWLEGKARIVCAGEYFVK